MENISKVTLGTAQLGLSYGIANKTGKPSSDKAFEMLDTAFAGGISSFDTSHEYGDSEYVLGNYFSMPKNIKKEPFFSTKFKLPPDITIDENRIQKQIYSFCEQSMSRLGINRIPLYMLHNPVDMIRFGDIVSKTMKKLISEKYIVNAGVSVYTVEEASEMMKNDVYSAVQLPMNIFDQRFIKSGMLKSLVKNGIAVFVRSVFLQGLFFLDPSELPPGFDAASDYIKRLKNLSKRENKSVAEIAFSFIRDLDEVTSVVLGVETTEQVMENIHLLDCNVMGKTLRNEIDHLFADAPIEHIMSELRKIKIS